MKDGNVKVADKWIECDVAIWATGVAASFLGEELGAETDKAGRVLVNKDLIVPNHQNIFVIGDMAHLKQENGESRSRRCARRNSDGADGLQKYFARFRK